LDSLKQDLFLQLIIFSHKTLFCVQFLRSSKSYKQLHNQPRVTCYHNVASNMLLI